MMTFTMCPKCWHGYEFYKAGTIIPPCPKCGYPHAKETGEEFCKSLGIDPNKK